MKNADKDREKTICLCFSSWLCRVDENFPVAGSPREFRFVTADGNIPEAPVEIKKRIQKIYCLTVNITNLCLIFD